MIRRNFPTGDHPTQWLLLSQVEHARMSAELARAWGNATVGPLVADSDGEVRQELLAAIAHHDDGWAHWEACPAIDPVMARPYSFTEVPQEQGLPLWRDSIELARRIGPLAGWVVGGHFATLLAQSDEAGTARALRWQEEVATRRQGWLIEWQRLDPTHHTESLAQRALFALRMFDWLSLWLCCSCPATPEDALVETMEADTGPLTDRPLHCTPETSQVEGEPRVVTISPWPFAVEQLELDALGYAVTAQAYQTSEELARSRSPLRLRWRLLPA